VTAASPDPADGTPPLPAEPPTPQQGAWPSPGYAPRDETGGPAVWGAEVRDPSPSWRRRLGAAAITVAVVAVVGAPLGLLWAAVAPGVPIIKTDDGGAVFANPNPEEFIAADGWFTIILFSLGVVASLVSWIGFRRYRGPLTLLALALGGVGASILAWQVGRRIGLDDYRAHALAAAPGELLSRPPDLRAGGFTTLWDVVPFFRGDLLIATFGAVIVYTVLAGWSRTASLRPEPAVFPDPPPVGAGSGPYGGDAASHPLPPGGPTYAPHGWLGPVPPPAAQSTQAATGAAFPPHADAQPAQGPRTAAGAAFPPAVDAETGYARPVDEAGASAPTSPNGTSSPLPDGGDAHPTPPGDDRDAARGQ